MPERRAQPAGPARVNDYDSFAEAYAAENENDLVNAYHERPVIPALVGDVTGRRIWSGTTWRTGGRRWPSCGECSGPAAG